LSNDDIKVLKAKGEQLKTTCALEPESSLQGEISDTSSISNYDPNAKKSSNETSELTSDLTGSKAESKSSSSGSGQLIAELKLQTEKGLCHFKIFSSDN